MASQYDYDDDGASDYDEYDYPEGEEDYEDGEEDDDLYDEDDQVIEDRAYLEYLRQCRERNVDPEEFYSEEEEEEEEQEEEVMPTPSRRVRLTPPPPKPADNYEEEKEQEPEPEQEEEEPGGSRKIFAFWNERRQSGKGQAFIQKNIFRGISSLSSARW